MGNPLQDKQNLELSNQITMEILIARFKINNQITMEIFHLILLFLALIFLKIIFFKKPKNLPPSPPSLPILGHLHLLKKPHFRSLTKISNKYGPIVSLRFGSRPVLLVSSPSLIEECFTQKNDVIFTNRPRLLLGKHMGYNYTTLTSAPYGHNWRFLRRITTLEMLSSSRLQMFSNIHTDEVRSMIKRLKSGTESGECEYRTVEMKQTLFELSLNMMMRMIAGKRYYGDIVEDMEEVRRFREMVEETLQLSGSTNIGDFIRVFKWFGFNGLEKRIVRLKEKREVILQELIENLRRNEEEETKLTLIDVLLSLQKNEPEYYTDQMIKGLIWILLTGGTDTTTGTMEWAMSLLVNNPKVLKKAQTEIDIHLGQDHRLLNESDLSKLPYLHAIITETLRLYPAAPIIPRESSEDCIVGGYKIPRGTMLLVNLWGLQNDPKLWDDDPTEFKPERFVGLEGDRKYEGYKLMPFGRGRRGCPGEGLAMRVVSLGLGCLIQYFEWERVGKELVDMTEGIGLTIPKAQPLEAKCRPRSNMVHFLSQL